MEVTNHEDRKLVWLQVLYLFIIPTLVLYFNILPKNFRFLLILIVAILLYGIVKHAKWTYLDLGIFRGFWRDFWPYTIFTLAGIGFLFWLSEITLHLPLSRWWHNAQFLILFIPISVLQEIIFRGILMNMLKRAFSNPVFIIFLNASIFALIHVIYVNSTFVLPMTFMAGIGFAWIYLKYPNLILISISHTILNFVGMILGFFIIR